MESAASGIWAALGCALKMRGQAGVAWDASTVSGALMRHVTADTSDFQPMNANYGILEPLAEKIRDKALKKKLFAERALKKMREIYENTERVLR